MTEIENFSKSLIAALDSKSRWYDTEQLPLILDQYRLVQTCTKNLYTTLVQKSKITEDPYKLEKKISEVVAPENTPFSENEKSVILGTRFSDYESMMDFICTYFNFSVSYMNLNRIKNLVALNNSITWNNLSENSTNPNSRGLAELISQLKIEADSMTLSAIKDEISKNAEAIDKINNMLKDLTDFQHESYKGLVRKNVFEHPAFKAEEAFSSPQNEMAQIKHVYSSAMPKIPFYTVLIEEIINEDQGEHKKQLQEALFKKLQVTTSSINRKVEKIDPKQILMDAIYTLTAVSPQLSQIETKIKENHDILESLNNSGWQKFVSTLRKAFNIPDPEVIYQVFITDPVTKTEHKEQIEYLIFIKKLSQLTRFFSTLAAKQSSLYKKVENSSSDKIIEFLNKNVLECQKVLTQLTALDDFFKSSVPQSSSSRIKGLKMELTTLKNTLVKANQKRVEYTSYIEEEAQMKKLGLGNEE